MAKLGATTIYGALNVGGVASVKGLRPNRAGGGGWIGSSDMPFIDIYGTTIHEGGTALASKYLGINAKAADSELLDGVNSSSFLRSDATDYINSVLYVRADIRNEHAYRDHGVYGHYDSAKTNHIWSMGSSFRNAADGSNFGTLYGLAYKHTNNPTGGTMAGGHQMVWCNNGSPRAAMGYNGFWAQDDYYGAQALSTTAQGVRDAINELFQYASDGKTSVANAITGVGGTGVSASSTFAQLAAAITSQLGNARYASGTTTSNTLAATLGWQPKFLIVMGSTGGMAMVSSVTFKRTSGGFYGGNQQTFNTVYMEAVDDTPLGSATTDTSGGTGIWTGPGLTTLATPFTASGFSVALPSQLGDMGTKTWYAYG